MPPWKRFGAPSKTSWSTAAISPHALKPPLLSSTISNAFITAVGDTPLSVTKARSTTNPTSTNKTITLNACPFYPGKHRVGNDKNEINLISITHNFSRLGFPADVHDRF